MKNFSMKQDYRLNDIGLINRDKKISFKFNGKKYFGYEGDTLASALLANGVHLIGRSFKYHRPRGFFGAGVDEPYAVVQLYRNNETEPNVKATEQELFEGLEANSVNCWPSVNFDIGAINNFLKIFLPAGFYYKTFMWPKSFWYKVYEPFIRKAAGLGVASIKHDKERYEHKYEYCDLLVAGSGPSGLASAYAAAKNGARVILAEDKPRFGGSLLTSEVNIGNQSGKEWADNIISELKEMPNVIVKNRSQVFGYYDHNMLVMSEKLSDHLPKTKKYNPKQRLWYIRAKEVVISSGSIERPLVFGNNDTPGVMLSSAAKEYLKVYGVLVGKKPLIFTNNDSGYETAIEFKKNGVDPVVLDTRKELKSEIIDEAKKLNIQIKFSYVVVAAKGYKKVKSAEVAKISDDKKKLGALENINCDCICVSGFWTPTIHLASQSGNKTTFNKEIDAFVPGLSKQNETTLGYYLNTSASLIHRSISEMVEFVSYYGGKTDTVYGLAGLGDLYVSAIGGRNSLMGKYLGEGYLYKDAKEKFMKNITVEGAQLALEIGPKILEELDQKDFPLMFSMLKTICENKKLEIKW